jgi:signal transduction histidine kinase
VTIKTEFEDVFIKGHTLIRTAIGNVLENTVQHSNKPPEDIIITVKCTHEDDGYVHLSITDNGPGIPEGERQVLESGVETELDHVSGLGLWLVKWVTEGIDGILNLSNVNGGGTEVEFMLIPSSISPSTEEGVEVDALANDKIDPTEGIIDESAPIETTTRK